ncbi:zf-HC2 domain-containing protein [Thermomonospora cellulosilytica]|uniref:Anti-sigma factor RsiW n=1 Tax=Thermomonospora cellulosilytica TaxID=1411118 RepID=A0A7W3N4U7_9ACTN|nr:zf-HC2 domain-containing protein [Thermomonospora cellulosilytica]MBA9007488.1 anti-sigma factor RsiW [Thermomonospora cellulosilytica]
MPDPVEHTDVGAYALGLLEDADRRAFEEHLAGCPACAAELRRLTGAADALRALRDDPGADQRPSGQDRPQSTASGPRGPE